MRDNNAQEASPSIGIRCFRFVKAPELGASHTRVHLHNRPRASRVDRAIELNTKSGGLSFKRASELDDVSDADLVTYCFIR